MTRSVRPNAQPTSDAAAWSSILAITVMVALCQWSAPLPIEPRGGVGLLVATVVLGGVAWFYRTVRKRENFAVMCIALLQVLLFSGVGIVLSYLVVRFNYPLWDRELLAWDRALGFDWLALMRFVDARPALAGVLHLAYGSMIPQIILLVLLLGFTNRLATLRTVMLAAIVTGTISILVSGVMPALTYPSVMKVASTSFTNVDPWAGIVHLRDFHALRDGTYTILDFGQMKGIIAFPSYHAGLSAVTLWGFLNCGQRWAKGLGVVLASLTIAATPVDGGHYLVDVLAGLAIAAASLAFATRAVTWVPSNTPLMAWPSRRLRAASAR